MSDNPFVEPDDDDSTIVRVGGRGPRVPESAVHTAAPETLRPRRPIAEDLPGEAQALPKTGRTPLVAAAAPLLDLLGRIASGQLAAVPVDARAFRERAVRALAAFETDCEAQSIDAKQVKAAHYALCFALDDAVLSTPWGQTSDWDWATHSLSSTFHSDIKAGKRFFEQLDEWMASPAQHLLALEVCYLCMALGLHGHYRLGSPELEKKRETLYELLVRHLGAGEPELSPSWRGVDAPHRGPPRGVPAWAVTLAVIAALGLAYVWASLQVNANGDEMQQAVVQIKPARPAIIDRAAPVVAATLPPAENAALERARSFLKPEVDAQLVEIDGDAQRVLIRVVAPKLFSSGSAALESGWAKLLVRIAEYLRAEPGAVTVVGHTDNQPMRPGARYQSNAHLSVARAEVSGRIMADAIAQPERFKSIGRADLEPLTDNDTDKGRERNRRIDVVLSLADRG